MFSTITGRLAAMRRIVLLVPLLAMGFAVIALSPSIAHASSPCASDVQGFPNTGTCNNQDPSVHSCSSSASTPAYAWVYDGNDPSYELGEADLRWSTGCSANWARGTQFVGCGSFHCTREVDVDLAWRYNPSDHSNCCQCWWWDEDAYDYNGFNPGSVWTNMEYLPQWPAQAKVRIAWFDPHNSSETYQGWNSAYNTGFGAACL